MPGFEEEPQAKVPFFFQDHCAVGTGLVVKPLSVLCRCAPFAVHLTEVIVVLDSFMEVLGFPNVKS